MTHLAKLTFKSVTRSTKRDPINDRREKLVAALKEQKLVHAALGKEALRAILRAVQRYDAFTPDSDPYAEHDFGALHYADHQVFWKFDYYDLDLTMHSPDASDPAVTARVLTVMVADEY